MDGVDELAGLRQLAEALRNGSMILHKQGIDTTQETLAVLDREIAHLETALARRI
ncbi:hypothetical protein [Caulobacter radicis]|uniref:hypothetical protein n=1 Tax=Caulobacter radicis TaxID=2172650 RepID=UPI001401C085|nr:hypothetical protein [Caulobacter radicis]